MAADIMSMGLAPEKEKLLCLPQPCEECSSAVHCPLGLLLLSLGSVYLLVCGPQVGPTEVKVDTIHGVSDQRPFALVIQHLVRLTPF